MSTPSRWPDELLDRMRETGDPPADQAVAQLFAVGQIQAVNAMMQTLVENDDLVPANMPQVIRDYLQTSGHLPSWIDPAQIEAGERLFWRYGPAIIAILHCYSLPFCYVARKGVQVLSLTTRLYSNPTRRVVETAQMVVDVMRPGGMGSLGTGIRTAQKVRLMHAGVRYQIHAYGGWNPEFGEPVNQEDLAGTLMAFSWVTLDGLARLGYALTAAEQEAYLHSWKIVGAILGVHPDLLPENMAAAEDLVRRIQKRQYAACPEGQQMTDALVKMMQYYLPGSLLDGVPAAMIHYFLEDYADLIGVKRAAYEAALVGPLRAIDGLAGLQLHASAPAARLHEVLSRKLIEALVWTERGGKRIPFTIPTELRQQWGVNWTP